MVGMAHPFVPGPTGIAQSMLAVMDQIMLGHVRDAFVDLSRNSSEFTQSLSNPELIL
jgi:aspartate aminotransferase-like enzyme